MSEPELTDREKRHAHVVRKLATLIVDIMAVLSDTLPVEERILGKLQRHQRPTGDEIKVFNQRLERTRILLQERPKLEAIARMPEGGFDEA